MNGFEVGSRRRRALLKVDADAIVEYVVIETGPASGNVLCGDRDFYQGCNWYR